MSYQTLKRKSLSSEESAIVDSRDIPTLETIKAMSREEMEAWDKAYVQTDLRHYNHIQIGWLETEMELIAGRPGHGPEVSQEELLDDVRKCNNCLRYKVWYCLNFPSKVKNTGGLSL